MTNEEIAQEISEKYKHYNLECSSLDCYLSAIEMAKYKDSQPQIIEILGKRVKIVDDIGEHFCKPCYICCFVDKCRVIRGFFKDSFMCKNKKGRIFRHFVEVDEDGNEIKR